VTPGSRAPFPGYYNGCRVCRFGDLDEVCPTEAEKLRLFRSGINF
jgi:hypothetical protein